jgi:hypothetical protein
MTTPTPRRPDDLVAALADAFDTVAPSERSAAEEELLDAGLDAAALAARFATIAAPTSRRTADHGSRRPASSDVATPRRRWRGVAIAATLIGAVAAALLAGRTSPERVAHTAAVPRAIEPPSSHSPRRRSAHRAERSQRWQANGGAQGTAKSVITPVGDAVESAAETEAIARAAGEIRQLLRMDQPLPAIVASGVARQKLALARDHGRSRDDRQHAIPAFAAASFANAERYSVDPTTCRLVMAGTRVPVAERFGLPFPPFSISSGRDPRRAGCEIMWNVEAAFAAGAAIAVGPRCACPSRRRTSSAPISPSSRCRLSDDSPGRSQTRTTYERPTS